MLPAIAAMVSLSPPMETASRTQSSNPLLSRNASSACGTDPWPVSYTHLEKAVEILEKISTCSGEEAAVWSGEAQEMLERLIDSDRQTQQELISREKRLDEEIGSLDRELTRAMELEKAARLRSESERALETEKPRLEQVERIFHETEKRRPEAQQLTK